MVVSSPVPSPASSQTSGVSPEVLLAPSPVPKPVPKPVPNPPTPQAVPSLLPSAMTGPAVDVESNPVLGPSCNLRSRGMGKFPPRLAREPRRKNGPHAQVNLPQLPLGPNIPQNGSGKIPPLSTRTATAARDEDILTLEMRPARLHVSSLWHRLRFTGFSPMARQRRSTWKPGKPRRGRPEGTKGAGSRSI